MSLANIEHKFLYSLIDTEVDDGAFLSQLCATNSLNPARQLSIYRSNINGAHQKVLGQIYPACLNILGEDYFDFVCRLYRFKYPSTHADLNQHGEHFPHFIKEVISTKRELAEFEYLPDLANHEWYWHAAFFTKDSTSFDFAKLAKVEEHQQHELVFELRPDFSLHKTPYPILDIWLSNRSEPDDEQTFAMPDSEICYCIFRKEYEVMFEKLDAQQYGVLYALANGSSLGMVAQQANNNLQSMMMFFINKGWVTDCRL